MDLADIEKTKPYLEQEFHYVVHPYAEDADCYNGEIIQKDMDKGEAMERVCEYYGADMADTVAFGDSMNDFEVLQAAGTGIAMGNAVSELKEIADYVTADIEEDGIFKACRYFHLI